MTKQKTTKQKPINKCIVQVVGSFTYLNTDGAAVHNHRPTVVVTTGFIETLQMTNKIKVLATNLPKEASDVEFEGFLKESNGDVILAVTSYCAKFGLKRTGEVADFEPEKLPKTTETTNTNPENSGGDVDA